MSLCLKTTPLVGEMSDAGLFHDVGALTAGRVRLRLVGARMCHDIQRPFYEFDILTGEVQDNEHGTASGTLTLFAEPSANVVGPLGHVGGALTEAMRGDGVFGEALQAVLPLARRHAIPEIVVSFPPDNDAAIRGAQKLGLHRIADLGSRVRFAMPTGYEELPDKEHVGG